MRSQQWNRCLLLWIIICLSVGFPVLTAAPTRLDLFEAEYVSKDPSERQSCEAQLNLISEAIHQYLQLSKKLPDRLSDLVPDFLSDRRSLICPFVRKTRDLSGWQAAVKAARPAFRSDVLLDPRTSYAYEFCLEKIPSDLWRGTARTYRDYKLSQMEKVGSVVPIVRCLAHKPFLNLAYDGQIYGSDLEWEDKFVPAEQHQKFEPAHLLGEIKPRQSLPPNFSPRPRDLSSFCIDLTAFYNAALADAWQGFPGNDLSQLGPGSTRLFNNINFDVRGVIQLGGLSLPKDFPMSVDGIPINQKCSRIHFLHARGMCRNKSSHVANYVVHYANRATSSISVVHGRDIGDFWFPDGLTSAVAATVAWAGENEAAKSYGRTLRVYQMTWDNPVKDVGIDSISFSAVSKTAAPFLLAITLEP